MVYRNGVGYFERQGRTTSDHLEFHVREGDVGDFLATLAVMEQGGSSVRAAAFPGAAQNGSAPHANDRRTVTLSLDGHGRDIAVGYTVETPIWRPSYRLIFDPQGHAQFQLWGIVQNHSGEDWRNVRLSLVAGSPVAFRAELGSATMAARPTVTDNGEVIQAVPHADSTLAQEEPDRDGDGIQDISDQCPTSAEDRDGLSDDDGCPDIDNDHDRIADVDDRCPNQPETYNGQEDSDGCPDRGIMVVSESSLRILDIVRFDAGSDHIRRESVALLEAVAQTLVHNPQITRVRIEGHADPGESAGSHGSHERLATARARAVFTSLVAHGVPAERLVLRGAVDSRSLAHAARGSADARGRVEFQVLEVDGVTVPTAGLAETSAHNTAPSVALPTASPPSLSAAPRSIAALAAIASMGAATRYDLPGTVTVPNGDASMVLLVSRAIEGERMYLFAPDSRVAPSASHPFQVARMRNATGGLLEHGPVALFDSGAFLGQGMLDPLPADATATIPFALERGIVVESAATRGVEGVRLVHAQRDRVTLERDQVERTTYTVRSGIDHSVRVVLRHALTRGVALASPPRGTEQSDDAALVPIDVPTRARASQQVVTRVPFAVQTTWDDELAAEAIEASIRDRGVSPSDALSLRAALDLRGQIRALMTERASLEQRHADLDRAVDDTRMNLLTIERNRTAGDLRVQLTARLARTASDIDQLVRHAVELDARIGELRVRLAEAVRAIDVTASPAR